MEMPITVKQIPEEEVRSAPLLILQVLESHTLRKGQRFEINAGGLTDSTRGARDGCVYIGTKLAAEPPNDLVIPEEEQGMGERHMMIRYSPENKGYLLKDLGEGTGTFVRVVAPLTLRQGYIISFGDSHMVVNIRLNGKIQLKFLDGPKTDQTFTFSTADACIKIGRINDCDKGIRFEESSMSRYQCTIEYIDGNWVLQDGYKERRSTNGTWLFVDDFFPIFDNMVFKTGQTLFSTVLRQLSSFFS